MCVDQVVAMQLSFGPTFKSGPVRPERAELARFILVPLKLSQRWRGAGPWRPLPALMVTVPTDTGLARYVRGVKGPSTNLICQQHA